MSLSLLYVRDPHAGFGGLLLATPQPCDSSDPYSETDSAFIMGYVTVWLDLTGWKRGRVSPFYSVSSALPLNARTTTKYASFFVLLRIEAALVVKAKDLCRMVSGGESGRLSPQQAW